MRSLFFFLFVFLSPCSFSCTTDQSCEEDCIAPLYETDDVTFNDMFVGRLDAFKGTNYYMFATGFLVLANDITGSCPAWSVDVFSGGASFDVCSVGIGAALSSVSVVFMFVSIFMAIRISFLD